jgi:hypothetical protein
MSMLPPCRPQEQPFTDVEMPGQHSTGEDPSPDGVVLLVGIGADVPVVRADCRWAVSDGAVQKLCAGMPCLVVMRAGRLCAH